MPGCCETIEWDCSDKDIAWMFNIRGQKMSGMSHRRARCWFCEQFLACFGHSLARLDIVEMSCPTT